MRQSELRTLCDIYLKHNACKTFIIGIKNFHNINACIISGKKLIDICIEENIIEYDTRKNSIRFIYQPNKHKGFLRIINESIKSFPICSWKNFQNEKKQPYQGQYYNFGDTFERLIYKKYDKAWFKDNCPWWVSGDIIIDNEDIQIKDASHRATLFALHHLTNNNWI